MKKNSQKINTILNLNINTPITGKNKPEKNAPFSFLSSALFLSGLIYFSFFMCLFELFAFQSTAIAREKRRPVDEAISRMAFSGPDGPAFPLKAVVRGMSGNVLARLLTEQDWRIVEPEMTLLEGDELATGFDSKASIFLEDLGLITLGECSRIKLERFFETKASGVKGALPEEPGRAPRIARVIIWFTVGNLRIDLVEKNGWRPDVLVATPDGLVNCMGKSISLTCYPDKGTYVRSIAGRAEARNNPGTKIPLDSGEETFIKAPFAIPRMHADRLREKIMVDMPVSGLSPEERRILELRASPVPFEEKLTPFNPLEESGHDTAFVNIEW